MIEKSARSTKETALLIVNALKKQGNIENVNGMARYGISTRNTYGVPMPFLRCMSRGYRGQHELALALWNTEVHEARIFAALIDDPKEVTRKQMELWVKDIDSWDICDQTCGNLFDKTAYAYEKALEWSERKEEFVKRAGFVIMTQLAVHDKKMGNATFLKFLPLIKREAADERNFVKKAVNWALRQIGKRNDLLHKEAIQTAKEIELMNSRSARWIAKDALREFASETTRRMLERRRKAFSGS